MDFPTPDEVNRSSYWLLRHLEEVRRVLEREGFSPHAVEQAITVNYQAAMPYITGRKPCPIQSQRAWLFKIAFGAAGRAADRDVDYRRIEPAILSNLVPTVTAPKVRKPPFNLRKALSQLTPQQRQAVEWCFLRGQSLREAARIMGKSARTVSGHLKKGKERLKVILAQHEPPPRAA